MGNSYSVHQVCFDYFQESLRKYSVVPVVTRNLAADDELGGYKLPKGSWIVCHIKVGNSWLGVWACPVRAA